MRLPNKKKTKYYKNTHGTVYRVGSKKKPKKSKSQQKIVKLEA
jgi:hypothetical protein